MKLLLNGIARQQGQDLPRQIDHGLARMYFSILRHVDSYEAIAYRESLTLRLNSQIKPGPPRKMAGVKAS